MRRILRRACGLALCALACLLGAERAHAAWWLVPAGAQAPSTIATTLGRAGVSSNLGAVTAGLNAAYAMREQPRLVELETGVVRPLGAGALAGVSFARDGELQTLAELLAEPGVVLVVDLDAASGPVLRVVSSDGRVQSEPLAETQAELLGELPCGEGYAPVSFAWGVRCEDVDECVAGLDACDAHASCDNTAGGYECACDDGYAGDGRTCDEESAGAGGDEGGGAGGSGDDSSAGGSGDEVDAGRDAGTADGGDAPSADAGGPDEPSRADAGDHDGGASDGGCDCNVHGLGPSALAHPIVLTSLWLVWRRRRQSTKR